MNDVTGPAALLAAPRILVIDDNRAIHDDFRKIFGASRERPAPSAAEVALFGASAESTGAPEFLMESAYQGQEGLAMVRLARERQKPYSVAFVDVRMPPGWDGVETTARIWQEDSDIQIVICTAYSDYSWGEMLAKLGRSDRLVILKKPFDTIEVVQLASSLTEKWRLARQSRSLMEGLERRVAERTHELVQSVEELGRSERLKGAILESSLDCVVTIDHEGKIVEFNPAAELTFGSTRKHALGRDMVDMIVPPRLRDAHRRGFAHYLATAEGPILGKRVELAAMRADGTEFAAELAITAIGGTPKPMFTGFIRDITERNEANAKIKRLNRVYAVLSGINTLILRVRDRDALFREACQIAVEQGQFKIAWIGIVNRSTMSIEPIASAGSKPEYLAYIKDRFSLLERPSMEFTMTARAVLEKKALFSNDTQNDPAIKFKKEHLESGTRSLASIPLLVSGEVEGVLCLYTAEAGFFDREELTLLTELAGDIGFAMDHIQKALKLARVTRVNAMLSGINGAIVHTRERKPLFQEVCRIAVESGGLTCAWLCIVDEKRTKLLPMGYAGPDDGFLEMIVDRLSLLDDAPIGHGISARSVREKRTIRVGDVAMSPDIAHKKPYADRGIKSSATFPLLIADRVIGSFSLNAAEIDFFDDEEVQLLEEVARNISFALEHMEKEDKVRRLTRVYAVLSGINGAIVRIHERDGLFREVCRIAVADGEYFLAQVVELDAKGKARIAASTESDTRMFQQVIDDYNSDPEHSESMLAIGLRSGQPQISNDVDSDPRAFKRTALTYPGIYGIALLPIIVDKRVIGEFNLRTREGGKFDEAELQLLLEVVANLSFALEHIDKEEKVLRLTRVHAVLSGINGAIVRIRERDALFRETCRIAVSEGGFALARVVEVDAAGKARIAATSESDTRLFQKIIDEYNSDPEHSASLLAVALRSRQILSSNDVANDPRIPNRAALTRDGNYSLALLPIIVEQRVTGAVILRSREAGLFDNEELHLLHEVVSNLSFALEHLDKEAKVRRLTRVHAVLSGINALIVRARDRDELFTEACRIAVEHGKFAMSWIGAFDPVTEDVTPVAWAGEAAEELTRAKSSARADTPRGSGAVGQAIRARQPVFNNNILTQSFGGPRLQQIMRLGFQSHITLPLFNDQKIVATLTLYTREKDYFDAEELRLLTGLASDISSAISNLQKQERLDYLAYYDELTGLANRRLFLERLAQYMRGAASGGHKLALFFVDLERFRNINDSFGRPAGDALLKQVAEWLSRLVGDPNVLARLGADHFAAVLPEVKQDRNVAGLLEKGILKLLDHSFRLNDTEFRVAAKVGVALFPQDGADADALLRSAEVALKKAKARGDRYLFYKPKMNQAVTVKFTMENQLRQALANEEFVLHYQPKVSLDGGKLTGAEALIRWNDPRTGLVPPGRFIPVLEETGLILDVGRWALHNAVADYLRWRDAGLPAARIAVNVSPLQLRDPGFTAEIQQVIGIDPRAAAGLELEITESLIMDDVKHNISSLTAIRAMGVTIAIDDFGTGFSSLSYLAKLPIDTLKIDRSFVIDMTAEAQGLSLVSTIINLAHAMKLKVVAEGVETEEQSRLLRLLRCDEMQGFLFSKPVPAEIFEAKFLAPAPVVAAA